MQFISFHLSAVHNSDPHRAVHIPLIFPRRVWL